MHWGNAPDSSLLPSAHIPLITSDIKMLKPVTPNNPTRNRWCNVAALSSASKCQAVIAVWGRKSHEAFPQLGIGHLLMAAVGTIGHSPLHCSMSMHNLAELMAALLVYTLFLCMHLQMSKPGWYLWFISEFNPVNLLKEQTSDAGRLMPTDFQLTLMLVCRHSDNEILI